MLSEVTVERRALVRFRGLFLLAGFWLGTYLQPAAPLFRLEFRYPILGVGLGYAVARPPMVFRVVDSAVKSDFRAAYPAGDLRHINSVSHFYIFAKIAAQQNVTEPLGVIVEIDFPDLNDAEPSDRLRCRVIRSALLGEASFSRVSGLFRRQLAPIPVLRSTGPVIAVSFYAVALPRPSAGIGREVPVYHPPEPVRVFRGSMIPNRNLVTDRTIPKVKGRSVVGSYAPPLFLKVACSCRLYLERYNNHDTCDACGYEED